MRERKLEILRIIKETQDCISITFRIPDSLKDDYRFLPGQYVILALEIDNEKYKRAYSICSCPYTDSNLTIAVKRVPGGKVSNYLNNHLKEGDFIAVEPPNGNFQINTTLFSFKAYFFFAGGSGITPILSMVQAVLLKEPFSKVTLFYGNVNQESIIFKDKLYLLELEFPRRFTLIHVLSAPAPDWKGEVGMLDRKKCTTLIEKYIANKRNNCYYICGPQLMMTEVVYALKACGINESRIKLEYFSTVRNHDREHSKQSKSYDGIKKETTLILNGESHIISFDPGQSILDAALEAHLDAPYSCRAGICSSCKGKLISGKVSVETTTGLTQEEIEQGYVLTCQAQPITEHVIIEYNDVKAYKISRRRQTIGLASGLLFGVIVLNQLSMKENEALLCKGPMNTGHEKLDCQSCHQIAPGTVRQNVQANVNHFLGFRKTDGDFGYKDVDNIKCLNCHERPNDRHPVHRFSEPRFEEVRDKMQVEKCETCHREHSGKRVTLTDMGYCSNCHKDINLKQDPLDMPHKELAKANLWNTCLRCHDFHGNHEMTTATLLKDTIPVKDIVEYINGGTDPYAAEKIYKAINSNK